MAVAKIDAAQRFARLVGLLPRQAHRVDVGSQTGIRVGQRVDVSTHPRVDPGRPGLHILRLGSQPLHQVITGLGRDVGQLVERRPRPLWVDVIRGQR